LLAARCSLLPLILLKFLKSYKEIHKKSLDIFDLTISSKISFLFFFFGKKPKNKNLSIGKPETEAAQVKAEGPGIGIILTRSLSPLDPLHLLIYFLDRKSREYQNQKLRPNFSLPLKEKLCNLFFEALNVGDNSKVVFEFDSD
jgi:hypothetical protein